MMNIFKAFGHKDRWEGAQVDPSTRESKKVRGALGDALKRHFPEYDAALSLAEQRAEFEAKLDAQMQDPKAHYYNLDPRQKSMEKGWGPGAMSVEDRRDMEGRDESYGEWVERRIEERAKKQEDTWKKKFAEEGHTMPKRFENRPVDEVLEDDYMIDEDKKWADKVALEKPELGEGVPVKGRGLPQKYYSDRPRPSAEGEVPGRTDFLDEKQYTKRPKGQTLADKRAGRPVLNMFKVFGLKKNKNTPGGPDLQTDPVTGEISVVPDPEEDEDGGENGD